MSNNHPLKAREIVYQMGPEDVYKSIDDVYVVWFCYILGGWKALVSTTVMDGRYYEVTHDGEKNSTYVDVYEKQRNVEISWGVEDASE